MGGREVTDQTHYVGDAPPHPIPKPVRKSKSKKGLKMGKRPRRQRKSTLAALKRELWALLSAYVKERDGNVCISCGARGLEGRNLHAGHLFSAGQHSLIRFDPLNVHVQCGRCNVFLRGNIAPYTAQFLKTYGLAQFERLDQRSHISKSWRAFEIQELIEALKKSGADYESLYAERY